MAQSHEDPGTAEDRSGAIAGFIFDYLYFQFRGIGR